VNRPLAGNTVIIDNVNGIDVWNQLKLYNSLFPWIVRLFSLPGLSTPGLEDAQH